MDFILGFILGFGAFFGFIAAAITVCILIWLLGCIFALVMVFAFITFIPFWSMYCYFKGDKSNEHDRAEYYTIMVFTAFILLCLCEYLSINAVNMIVILPIVSIVYMWFMSLSADVSNSTNPAYEKSVGDLISDVSNY